MPHQHITHALSALLAPLSFEEIKAMELYPVIQQGLQSPLPDVQLLALEQARKMTEVDDAMLVTLIDCLGAEDASVGKKAVDVIASVRSHLDFRANSSNSPPNAFKRSFCVSHLHLERLCKYLDSSTWSRRRPSRILDHSTSCC